MKGKLLIFSSVLFLLPQISFATGIQVSPSKIEAAVKGHSATFELVVVNPTPDVQVFDVFADDFQDNLKSNPTSFTLEAGGRRKVEINFIDKGLQKNSNLSTFLSVVGTPLAEGRLQARTGVKVAVSLNMENSSWYEKIPNWAYILAGILAAAGVSFALGRKFKIK